jgi:hypothetical protein
VGLTAGLTLLLRAARFAHAALDFSRGKFKVTHPQPQQLVVRLSKI